MTPGETDRALSTLSACVSNIKAWMSKNMLLLNDEKTEFFVAANHRLLKTLSDVTITIGNTVIKPSSCVKNLGVIFDSTMSMSNHVSSICKTINFHLRNLSQVGIFIDEITCHHAVRALVTARLDYANSLLQGSSSKEIKRLQRLQNRAAKLIFKAKKYDHVSPLLRQLHWLPVQDRIDFKTLTIAYKCVTDSAPSYLCELITPYQPNHSGLRSNSDSRIFKKPFTHLTAANKGFYTAAPSIWNELPSGIRHASSLSQFKTSLKTHLF